MRPSQSSSGRASTTADEGGRGGDQAEEQSFRTWELELELRRLKGENSTLSRDNTGYTTTINELRAQLGAANRAQRAGLTQTEALQAKIRALEAENAALAQKARAASAVACSAACAEASGGRRQQQQLAMEAGLRALKAEAARLEGVVTAHAAEAAALTAQLEAARGTIARAAELDAAADNHRQREALLAAREASLAEALAKADQDKVEVDRLLDEATAVHEKRKAAYDQVLAAKSGLLAEFNAREVERAAELEAAVAAAARAAEEQLAADKERQQALIRAEARAATDAELSALKNQHAAELAEARTQAAAELAEARAQAAAELAAMTRLADEAKHDLRSMSLRATEAYSQLSRLQTELLNRQSKSGWFFGFGKH